MPSKKQSKNPEIKEHRRQIDKIDNQILKLLKERFEISKKIGKYKKQNNLPVKNKKREKQLLEKNKSKAKDFNLKPDFVKKLFRLILKESRRIQRFL